MACGAALGWSIYVNDDVLNDIWSAARGVACVRAWLSRMQIRCRVGAVGAMCGCSWHGTGFMRQCDVFVRVYE